MSWSLLIYTDRLPRTGKSSVFSNERYFADIMDYCRIFTWLKFRTDEFVLQNELVYRNHLKPTDFSLLLYLALPSY